jgi:hypothetical protein
MFILKHHDKVPPGGWRYHDERFDREFKAPNPHLLISLILNHYHANQTTPPQDLALLVDTYICNQLEDANRFCKPTEKPTLASRIKLAKQALKNWMDRGFKLTTPEQLAERQAICQSCPHWQGSAVMGVGACGACGCTGLKQYSVAENCPADKWPKL